LLVESFGLIACDTNAQMMATRRVDAVGGIGIAVGRLDDERWQVAVDAKDLPQLAVMLTRFDEPAQDTAYGRDGYAATVGNRGPQSCFVDQCLSDIKDDASHVV